MTDTCLQAVQRYDYERYLTTLFAPPRCRPALWALYAFNLEIAKTREVTTQATVGLIRLQWWRDAIQRMFDGKTDKHDVIQRLDTALRNGVEWHIIDFQILLEGRERDLYDDPMTESDFWEYCLETSAPLLRLALKACGEADDDAVIEHTAQAYAAVGLLRASSVHAAQGRQIVPSTDIKELAARIENKLSVRPRSKTISLYRRLTRIHLRALARVGYDPTAARFVQQDLLLPFKLWLAR